MERFRSGSTRIIIASDCFTWGVDVPDIRQVIVFDLPSSFSKLVQQIGRAGRDKQQAYAITYAPPWVRDIDKDPDELKKHEAADLKRREGMCQVLRAWFNSPKNSCPGGIFCDHFGDKPSRPKNCCIKHHEILPTTVPEASRVEEFATKRTKDPTPRSDGTYAPFKKGYPLRISASNMVSAWVRRVWDEVRKQNSLLPPTSFLSQELQDRLCDRFHTITTIERLCSVLADWPQIERYKVRLFALCQEALRGLDGLRKELREKCEGGDQGGRKVVEGNLPKIRIQAPAVPEDNSDDEAPPRKRRRQEPRSIK